MTDAQKPSLALHIAYEEEIQSKTEQEEHFEKDSHLLSSFYVFLCLFVFYFNTHDSTLLNSLSTVESNNQAKSWGICLQRKDKLLGQRLYTEYISSKLHHNINRQVLLINSKVEERSQHRSWKFQFSTSVPTNYLVTKNVYFGDIQAFIQSD